MPFLPPNQQRQSTEGTVQLKCMCSELNGLVCGGVLLINAKWVVTLGLWTVRMHLTPGVTGSTHSGQFSSAHVL